MRPARGCEACRERHVKCVTGAGDAACKRCTHAGRPCLFAPRFRFKLVEHIDSLSDGAHTRYELKYAASQKWVCPRRPLNFILEDGSGLEYGVPDTEEPVSILSVDGIQGEQSAAASDTRSGPKTFASPSFQQPLASPLQRDTLHTTYDTTWRIPDAQGPCSNGVDPSNYASPASISELSRRHETAPYALSPVVSAPLVAGDYEAAISPTSLPTPSLASRPNLSRREASLLQHFIRKIAPWNDKMDVCDVTCQFTHEVPRRAMQQRMLLFAVLAVSSRHLALMAKQSEPAEASFYQGQSVRCVIEALSGPETGYDDNLLSTVVCLRLYEELEHSTDERLHLRGMSKLISAIPDFAYSGGLAEAACWQSLRQDIYISLVHAQPPSFRLESFERSSVFTFRDDGACANIVILLFAKILRQTYTPDAQNAARVWQQLEADLAAWNERRMRLFQPIYYEAADPADDRLFPIIQMISPPQVAALQYYHACRTFLTLHKPADHSLSGFGAAKRRRTLEREVAKDLANIVGLAESNPFVENANFTALHLLRIAGYCITSLLQRQHVIKFLRHVETTMGWGTYMVVDLLQDQWSDLDNLGS